MKTTRRNPVEEIDLVIFDLDGTLIDSAHDIANSCNYALEGVGLTPWPVEKIKGLIGGGTKTLVKDALAGNEHLFDDAFKLFGRHYREHLLDHTRLYKGTEEVLRRLAGKSLAILSNKRQSFCDPIIDGLNLRNSFALVVGGDTPPKKKPDPASVIHVCSTLGIPAERSLMIGDSAVDVSAGREAGARTIGLTGGFTPASEVKNSTPDFLFESVADLLNFIS